MNQTCQHHRNLHLVAPVSHSDGAHVAAKLSWLRQLWSSWTVKLTPSQPAAGRSAGLLQASKFVTVAERELRRSLRRNRHISLAVFEFRDLACVCALHGNEAAKVFLATVQARLVGLAGHAGAVAQIGPEQYAVLFPGLDRPGAVHAIHRVLGDPVHVEVEAGDTAVVLVPAFEVECANDFEHSMAALQRELCRDLMSDTPRKRARPKVARKPAPVASHPAPVVACKPVLVWHDDPAVEAAYAARGAFPSTVAMGLTAVK